MSIEALTKIADAAGYAAVAYDEPTADVVVSKRHVPDIPVQRVAVPSQGTALVLSSPPHRGSVVADSLTTRASQTVSRGLSTLFGRGATA